MLLMENKDDELDKDNVISALQASNRELARQLADMKESRDFYKRLYYELIDNLLERVNIAE